MYILPLSAKIINLYICLKYKYEYLISKNGLYSKVQIKIINLKLKLHFFF